MKQAFIELDLQDRPTGDLPRLLHEVLLLVQEFVGTARISDTGPFDDRVRQYASALQSHAAPATLAALGAACVEECRRLLDYANRQLADHHQELASLIDVLHEAIGTLAGGDEAYAHGVEASAMRLEGIARLDDVREVRRILLAEVATLTALTRERQRQSEQVYNQLRQQVDTLQRQLERTRAEALLDPLTQVGNRRGFERVAARWCHEPGARFAIGLLDVDDFKRINDTRGHQAGDRVLCRLAQTLTNAIRPPDFVGRFGGEEFVVLLWDVTLRAAEARVSQLCATLGALEFGAAPGDPDGPPFRVTVSAGVAEFSAGDTIEALIQRADEGLYAAKRHGKNRVVARARPLLRDLRWRGRRAG